MNTLRIIGLATAASLLAVAWLLMLDTITVGRAHVLPLTGVLTALLGVPLALISGAALAVLHRLDRWRNWTPGRGVMLIAPFVLVYLLADAHGALTNHLLGAILMNGYALLAGFVLSTGFLAIWHAQRRRWALGTVLLLVGLSIGLHQVNAHHFVGLYPELHFTLTTLSIAAVGLAFALLLRQRPRWQMATIGMGLLAAGVGALCVNGDAVRTTIYLQGTELAHTFSLVARDADGDGVAGGWMGGDCDDTDPEIHPLRFERPGNGKDDNCRLGDAPATPPKLSRTLDPPAPAAAWRTAHPDVDVVVLFIDTLRADHLTAEHMPNLWALAQRGAWFQQARTTVPRTPHAMTSLLTGRWNGRNLKCRRSLRPPDGESLVARLKGLKLHTIGRLVGKDFKRRKLTRYFNDLGLGGHVSHSTGKNVTRDSLRMVKKATGRFALLAHYADAHAPYDAPMPFAVESDDLRTRYRAEVRYTDHQIGQLFKGLKKRKRWQNTLIVAIADHGENLGEHGESGGHHGGSVYDEVLHVPLIVAGPGIDARQVATPVSIVDVAPTLLDLLGARAFRDADGRSLAPALLGQPLSPAPTISEFYDFGRRLRTVVDGRFKLIEDVKHDARMLFDVHADPGETLDVAARYPDETQRLQGILDQWLEHRIDRRIQPSKRCPKL